MTKRVEVESTPAGRYQTEDPVRGSFLNFLASDIAKHPQRIEAINPALVLRLTSLVGNVAVDIDKALSEGDK